MLSQQPKQTSLKHTGGVVLDADAAALSAAPYRAVAFRASVFAMGA